MLHPRPFGGHRSVSILIAALLACSAATNTKNCGPSTSPTVPADPAQPAPGPGAEIFTTADGVRFFVDRVASGVTIPWSLAFAPDGRLFFTERPGRVRIVQNGALVAQPALTIGDIVAQGESGALGLALHPNFAQTHYVYVSYTGSGSRGAVNRLVRYREVANTLAEAVVLLDNLDAASIHNGSRVKFGPDGRLYMTMGDAAAADNAQTLASYNGKILRINEDGSTPAGNLAGPVFTWGHRNPQGIDWHPLTGELWETEHGNVGNDEVNVIDGGRNYGWPVIEGGASRPDMASPIVFYTPSIAPSGASFYRGAAFPAFQNNFFFATLRGEHIHRLRLDPSGARRVVAEERLLESKYGRIRDVIPGPDGYLYFSTSNGQDDQILRLVPVR